MFNQLEQMVEFLGKIENFLVTTFSLNVIYDRPIQDLEPPYLIPISASEELANFKIQFILNYRLIRLELVSKLYQ